MFGAIAGGGGAIGLLLGGVLTQYLTGAGACTSTWSSPWSPSAGALALLREPATGTAAPPRRPRRDHRLGRPVRCSSSASPSAETAGWDAAVVARRARRRAWCCSPSSCLLQAKVASPLLPLRILATATAPARYLAILTVGIGMFGLFLFLTYYLQQNLASAPSRPAWRSCR